ncbi:hypothetical protein BDFB_011880, partial [Asbolus verrucosus]
FNLTGNGDYDIAGHKLVNVVNVKQPENPGDAVNLQYSESLRSQVDKVHDNMSKKDVTETIINTVKPELENMIKKDDSESMKNNIKKNINLTATKRYIDIGNRRFVKTADAIDKYDVVNKGQLDVAWQSQSIGLADYGEMLIKVESALMKNNYYPFLQFVGKIRFIKEIHGQKVVNVLDFSFDGEQFVSTPMNVEVIKFYPTANLKDLYISNNIETIDLLKPFIIKESDILAFRIKKEKMKISEVLILADLIY